MGTYFFKILNGGAPGGPDLAWGARAPRAPPIVTPLRVNSFVRVQHLFRF